MNELFELERILTDIDCLADTFLAIDTANQTEALMLPVYALSVPAEVLKHRIQRAKELQITLLRGKVSRKE